MLRFQKKGTYALFMLMFLYIAYHAINGNRGIISMLQINSELIEKEAFLRQLKDEQQKLEEEIKLLQPENCDLDLIDEIARNYFGTIGKNEKILYLD